MGLSFNEIKNNFVNDYLSKLPQYKDEPIIAEDINLTRHYKDFQKYLVKENLADESIFSKSLNELQFVDGKFVTNDSEEAKEAEENEAAEENKQAKGNEETEGAGDEKSVDDNFMADFLNDLFAQDEVINALDGDNSGDLDIAEIGGFLDEYAEVDENGEKTITLEGLSEGMQCELMLDTMYEDEKVVKFLDTDGDGVLSDEEKAQFEGFAKGDSENLTPDAIQEAYNSIMGSDAGTAEYQQAQDAYNNYGYNQEAQSYQNAVAHSAASGATGASSYGGGDYTPEVTTTDLNKPVEEMSLMELKAALEQTNADIEALGKEKEDIQKELDEAAKALEEEGFDEEQLQKREQMKEDISNQEKVIEDLKNQESEKQSNVDSAKSDLDEAKKYLNLTQNQLAACKSSEDRKILEANVKKAQQEVFEKEEAYQKAQEELEKIQEQIKKEEEVLEQKKEELNEFEQSAKQENLEKYDKAKQNLESKDFESKLNELNEKAQEIQQKIDEKKGSGEEAAEYAMQYVGYNEKDGSANVFLNGGNSKGTPWCAAFVQYALENSIGKENLPNWYNNIGNKWYCRNVKNAAKNAGAVIDASQAQAGDIITIGEPAHHIAMVVKVEGDTVYTVEGNTSKQGENTNGYGYTVATKQRKITRDMTFCSMN